MSDKLYLGTRKGLIEVTRKNGGWHVGRASFLGVSVPMLLPDRRDNTLYAAVEHGHFGTKFHASRDGGATWEERTCPAYPPKPEGVPDVLNFVTQTPIPWDLKKIWALEAGGSDGELWCGTLPGGLFHSTDGGASWSLVESLWNDPGRAKWMGGGAEWPGIHTILVDPRDKRRILLAVSCGGVWETRDNGATWRNIGEGIRAEYCPPELAYDPGGQDAHRIAWSAADPDTIWMQHHNGIFHSTDGGLKWREIENANPSSFGSADRVVRAGHQRRAACRLRWRAVRDAHERWRKNFSTDAQRPAAGERLSSRLSPLPGCERRRQHARIRQHHRLRLDQRGQWRKLAAPQLRSAAGVLRALRLISES
jgi:hypothetical protein